MSGLHLLFVTSGLYLLGLEYFPLKTTVTISVSYPHSLFCGCPGHCQRTGSSDCWPWYLERYPTWLLELKAFATPGSFKSNENQKAHFRMVSCHGIPNLRRSVTQRAFHGYWHCPQRTQWRVCLLDHIGIHSLRVSGPGSCGRNTSELLPSKVFRAHSPCYTEEFLTLQLCSVWLDTEARVLWASWAHC